MLNITRIGEKTDKVLTDKMMSSLKSEKSISEYKKICEYRDIFNETFKEEYNIDYTFEIRRSIDVNRVVGNYSNFLYLFVSSTGLNEQNIIKYADESETIKSLHTTVYYEEKEYVDLEFLLDRLKNDLGYNLFLSGKQHIHFYEKYGNMIQAYNSTVKVRKRKKILKKIKT